MSNEEYYDMLLDEITLKIQKGVETEDGLRIFDIIDLYSMVSDVDDFIRATVPTGKKINSNARIFKHFVDKNCSGKVYTASGVEALLNAKREINCKIGKNGFPEMGTGTLVPKEDIRELILFMMEHNIPIKDSTFNSVFTRYKNGISLEENPKQKGKNK